MNAALAIFDASLASVGSEAEAAGDTPLELAFEDGTRHDMPYAAWVDRAVEGDHAMVERCTGPTLDVGCGPGRLVEALLEVGIPALGIDISEEALRITRERGGLAVRRDVFTRVPGEHRWEHVILADGNIGIGGDPVGLLVRCGTLVADGGTVVVEVTPPGTESQAGMARLESGELHSPWFPWAVLSADDVGPTATAAGLTVRDLWGTPHRWFAELSSGG